MSSLINLAKELLPATKTWKSFTFTLRSKFHNLEIPKPIKKTTPRFIRSAGILRKIKTSAQGSCCYKTRKESSRKIIRTLIPHKSCGVAKGSSSHRHLQHKMDKNFAAIFVDELFAEPTYTISEPCRAKEVVGSSSGHNSNNAPSIDLQKQQYVPSKQGVDKVLDESLSRKINESETPTTRAAAWNELKKACKMLPELQGVDERAEEFISKFREDMRLEREQSIIEFQEMLARGV